MDDGGGLDGVVFSGQGGRAPTAQDPKSSHRAQRPDGERDREKDWSIRHASLPCASLPSPKKGACGSTRGTKSCAV